MADDPIVRITDHAQQAIERLSGQYREKNTLEGTVSLLARQVQDLEDTVFDILEQRKLAEATGVWLDALGEIADQPRQGFDDDLYRILIYVKIIENLSQGEPAAIISAFRLIMGAGSVQYVNLGGANVMLYADGELPPVSGSFLYNQLQRVVAAGVKIVALTTGEGTDANDQFALGGVLTGDPAVGKGLGSEDGTTIGGYFASIITNI
jgi:hypothetical protein